MTTTTEQRKKTEIEDRAEKTLFTAFDASDGTITTEHGVHGTARKLVADKRKNLRSDTSKEEEEEEEEKVGNMAPFSMTARGCGI